MDKLRKIIKYNKKMMLALSILVIISIIAGSIFSIILNVDDKKIVLDSINNFQKNISLNNNNYLNSIKNIFISNTFLIILIWLIGISIIGLFIVIGIIFWKGFTLGFTISSFIMTFKFKGLILSIFYCFPSLIINLLVFMYLSTYSIQLSLIIIKCITSKKTLNFKCFMSNYTRVLIISVCLIIISGLYEVFINPHILKFISNIIF